MKILPPFSFRAMRDEFINAVKNNQTDFQVTLTDEKISALFDFYEIVMAHNDWLHLVAPCSTTEFATRHVLESLTLLEFLPSNARFADVGTGAGLPAIPCLLAREDLRAVLIESSAKKASYLQTAIAKLGLENRAKIINCQFQEIALPPVETVTSRALDKFTTKLPALIKWSKKSRLALFGGNSLRAELEKLNIKFTKHLTPHSEQRFLFTT